MRFAGVVLAVVLATSTAYADTPLPFEIVRMLPETQQVLVYDRAHNTHVLLQPGSNFDDYVVIQISGLDMVVEKEQQRFTVYPREAKYLSLSLFPRASTQPVIFGKSAPETTPVPPAAPEAVVIAMPARLTSHALPTLSSKLKH